MVKGVVVIRELGALVIEVDFFLTIEFALELVGDLSGGDSVPEFINYNLGSFDSPLGLFDTDIEDIDFVLAGVHEFAPTPEGVILTYYQKCVRINEWDNLTFSLGDALNIVFEVIDLHLKGSLVDSGGADSECGDGGKEFHLVLFSIIIILNSKVLIID